MSTSTIACERLGNGRCGTSWSQSTLKFAEPDELVVPTCCRTSTYYGSEWHLQMVQAPAAWDFSLGANVTVAISIRASTRLTPTYKEARSRLEFLDDNSNTADYTVTAPWLPAWWRR